MNDNSWFGRVFRILITFFVFGFYIAMAFFYFRQNWLFLLTWEYWIDTSTATALAFMFRWLYSDRGVSKELEENEEIRQLESGKGTEIAKVNSNQLTDVLKADIEVTNLKNKREAYQTKCDKKINYYREKAWWKFRRKNQLDKWRKRREQLAEPDFNIKTVKVGYYKYDFDEMMSVFYKQPNKSRNRRQNKDQFVFTSLRTNMVTIIAFMIYNALEVLTKDFSTEELTVLVGKLIIFCVNIYTGNGLGRKYIRNVYSSNLTDDYAYLKGFNKRHLGGKV